MRIPKREHEQFGKQEFARLAGIPVAHLYNLWRSAGRRKLPAEWKPTRPGAMTIGEGREPDPQGRPGFLRVCIRATGKESKGSTTSTPQVRSA